MRELHAVTEALRGVFDAHGYGEVHTPALEYEQVLIARRPGGGRSGLQAVRRAGQRARPALGHDDPDRARRLHPLRARRAAAALLLRRARLPLRAPAARAGPRDAAGGHRAGRRARARGDGGGDRVLCAALDAVGPRGLPDRAGRRVAVPALLDAHGVPAGRARAGSCTSSSRATSSGSSARSAALGLAPEASAAADRRAAAARRAGGARAASGPAADRLRARASTAARARRWPSG